MNAPGSALPGFEEFLEETLPPLGLSPVAHRRRNIRRRLRRRMEDLGFHEFRRYLEYLKRTPEEVGVLRSLLPVTISRFYRNRSVFDLLANRVLPELAERGSPVRAWTAGCASGEEAYSLRMAWDELPADKPPLSLLATDIDPDCLARAGEGVYRESSLRELPAPLREKYFTRDGDAFRLHGELKGTVEFRRCDLLSEEPPGRFDLILCRNCAFTYFSEDSRLVAARALVSALSPGGWLVLGRSEKLPNAALPHFEPLSPAEKIYRLRVSFLSG